MFVPLAQALSPTNWDGGRNGPLSSKDNMAEDNGSYSVTTAPEAPKADACELSKTYGISHAAGNGMKDQKHDKQGLAPISLSS